jgi:rare lipoprotein A
MRSQQMSSEKRTILKGALTMLVAAAIGAAAGMSSMVVAAPRATPRDTADMVVPNEPSGEPGIGRRLDRSGRKQIGKASFYKDSYAGKTMADGTPMHLFSNNAASLTLPLGTTAKVKNLETGASAIVTIRDRGPYVKGRIVDLSPATARSIGLTRQKGVATVEVTPISFPNQLAPVS